MDWTNLNYPAVLAHCLWKWKKWVLVSFDPQGPYHSYAGKEMNFCRKITPACSRLDVVHWSLCRAQCTLHGNRVSNSAKHKNTIQTKDRLMARIITTQRFVPICVCIFWLNNFCPDFSFSLKITGMLVSSSWAGDSYCCSYVMQQLQLILSLKHHWAAKWHSTAITSEGNCWIIFWQLYGESLGEERGSEKEGNLFLAECRIIWLFFFGRAGNDLLLVYSL